MAERSDGSREPARVEPEAAEGPDADSVPGGTGPLVDWLMEHGLLRGPFLFADYWASVLGLGGRETHERSGWTDASLFRATLDRPDLELPRLRYYIALFFIGPLLLPFRASRRLGRYRIRYRREVGDTAQERLAPYRLELDPVGGGRVDVRSGDTVFAGGVLDPRRVAGFSSLFYAAYKLPIATITGIVAMAVTVPILQAAGLLDEALALWMPVVLPAVIVFLYVLYRDIPTAMLGAVPLLVGWLLIRAFGQATVGWGPFFGSLGLLLALTLLADWFFIPRPIPPVLMFYSRDEPGWPYERDDDAPAWLEGRSYWVWRYLILVPAEINKFWERDWERAEIWIRADGPEAGRLEWVVLDAHWRELWIPYERLGSAERQARQAAHAREHLAAGEPGVWLVEIDANLLFHTPFVRTVSFVPEGEDIHARSLWHLLSGAFARGPRDDPDDYLPVLDRLRLEGGSGVLEDLPEAVIPLAARHMLAIPWTHWRYALGAQRRREARLYGRREVLPDIGAAALQIKAGGTVAGGGRRAGGEKEDTR